MYIRLSHKTAVDRKNSGELMSPWFMNHKVFVNKHNGIILDPDIVLNLTSPLDNSDHSAACIIGQRQNTSCLL